MSFIFIDILSEIINRFLMMSMVSMGTVYSHDVHSILNESSDKFFGII
jgi:hypothetical protein